MSKHSLEHDVLLTFEFLGALPSCAKERSIRPVLYMALLQAEAAALNTTRLIKDAAIVIPISENTSTNGLLSGFKLFHG